MRESGRLEVLGQVGGQAGLVAHHERWHESAYVVRLAGDGLAEAGADLLGRA